MFQVQLKPNFLVSFDETLSLPGTAIVAGGSLGVIQEVDKAKHTVSISSTHLSAGKKSKTFSRKTTAIHHPCNHMLFSGVAQQLPYKLLGPTSPLWEHEHMYFMTRLIIGNLSNSSPPASQWDLLYGTVLHVNPALNGSDCYILVGFTLMNSQIQVPRYKRTNLYEPEQEYKVPVVHELR